MLRAVTLIAFIGVVAVPAAFAQPSVSPVCVMKCIQGKVCRHVLNSRNILEAQCLKNPPRFDPPGVCSAGEPLLVSNGRRLGFAFCGRGPSRIDCPAGYHCVIEPGDRYAVCCADVDRPGQCPAPSGQIGLCVFDPDVNCLRDSACPAGQKCCSEGCGKVCKNIVKPTPAPERPGQCPARSGLPGICLFDPNVNCVQDSECPAGKKCCSEGCGKVCKNIVTSTPTPDFPRGRRDVDRPGQCPAPSGQAGLCVFDPDVNCLQDSACPAGQKCCSEGCGNVCKNIVTSTPAPAFRCPVNPPNVDPTCKRRNKCSVQQRSNCPQGQLCCWTPCGYACVIPV